MTSQGNHQSEKVGIFFKTYRDSSTNQWLWNIKEEGFLENAKDLIYLSFNFSLAIIL